MPEEAGSRLRGQRNVQSSCEEDLHFKEAAARLSGACVVNEVGNDSPRKVFTVGREDLTMQRGRRPRGSQGQSRP